MQVVDYPVVTGDGNETYLGLTSDGHVRRFPKPTGGGGSGIPGGSNTHIQFNNSGAFDGDANLTWTPGTGIEAKLGAAFGNGATFGQLVTFQNDPTYGQTFNVPVPLFEQAYFDGDLSGYDFIDVVAGYGAFKHTGTNAAIAVGADFECFINTDSTGPFFNIEGIFGTALYGGTGPVDWIYGGFFAGGFSPVAGSSNATGVIGSYSIGESQNVNPNTSVYGVWADAHLSAPDSSASQLVALYAQPTLDGPSCFTPLAIGVRVAQPVYLGSPAVQATDVYGAYIEDQTSVCATNSWNMYSFGGGSQNTFEGKLNIGLLGSNTGNINLVGKTSGVVNLTTQDAAGSWTMKLPDNAGTSGYVLQTDGSGITDWVPFGGPPSTPNNSVQYNNGGSFGGAANFFIDTLTGNPTVIAGTDAAYEYMASSGVTFNIAFMKDDPSGANAFIGGAGNFTQTGNRNFGEGVGSQVSLTTGVGNMSQGYFSLNQCTTGQFNVAIGYAALQNLTTGQNNMALGQGAMAAMIDGSFNVAIGELSMVASQHDNFNVAVGTATLQSLNGGQGNVALGYGAGSNITVGVQNICIGFGAGNAYVTESNNIVLGADPGLTGKSNAIILSDAATGQRRTILDNNAGVYIGARSGKNVTNGGFNNFLGVDTGSSVVHGSSNLILGDSIDPGSDTSNVIMLGVNSVNRLDYNLTNSSKWTFANNINIAPLTTDGILVNDASGNVSTDTSIAAATVAANFTADHRLQISIAGTTYYLAASTTAW
jgi:hypothetical protein